VCDGGACDTFKRGSTKVKVKKNPKMRYATCNVCIHTCCKLYSPHLCLMNKKKILFLNYEKTNGRRRTESEAVEGA
jgi:hypothetical protein